MLDEMRGDANVKSTGRVLARNCTPKEWNSDRHRGMEREGLKKARPEWRRKVEETNGRPAQLSQLEKTKTDGAWWYAE